MNDALENQREQIGRRLRLKIRCGACRYLTTKAPGFEGPCDTLGKHAGSAGCNTYNPDFGRIRGAVDAFLEIGQIIRDNELDEATQHALAYGLINAGEMRRVTTNILGAPIGFGDEVVVNLSNPFVEYLNCYYIGSALTYRDGNLVLYSIVDNKVVHTMVVLKPGMVMTREQFAPVKRRLIRKGLLNAPKRHQSYLFPPLAKVAADYEPPTIDEAPRKLVKTSPTTVDSTGKKRRRPALDEVGGLPTLGNGISTFKM